MSNSFKQKTYVKNVNIIIFYSYDFASKYTLPLYCVKNLEKTENSSTER